MRGGVYARISEDRDETQLGVGRQLEDCDRLGGQRGWDIVDRYVDNDISAYRGGRRPEYERLLQDIASHRIDAVIVYHQDRLHRQPRELEEFFDVCDRAGLTHLASVSGDIDLSTHDGRLKARILGAVARNQSDAASRRLQRKMQELAKAGQPKGGGHRPFGFEPDRATIRLDEATVIRELADRLLAGEGLRGLCVDLANRGILTPTGGPWAPSVLRRMLRSPRISGQREHKGEIVATATWPAIISPEKTARITMLLDDPARRRGRPRRYLLTGIVYCAVCSTPLSARPRDDGARRYICAKGPGLPGSGCVYVLAEPLEEFIVEAVLSQLDTPELARAIRGRPEPVDPITQRLDVLTSRLDELATAYAQNRITMREWLTARDPLQRQLDDARRQSARDSNITILSEHAGKAGMLRRRWPDLTLDQRHAIIRAVLQQVLVGPGRRGYNRFDPGRFDMVWRH